MKPTKATAHLKRNIAYARIEFEDGPPGYFEATEVSMQLARGYGVSLGSAYEDLIPPKVIDTGSGGATLHGFTDDPLVIEVAEEFHRRLDSGEIADKQVFWTNQPSAS